MTGLSLANSVQDSDERQKLVITAEAETEAMMSEQSTDSAAQPKNEAPAVAPAQINHNIDIPNPPDLVSHVLTNHDMEKIFPYINPQMLYVRHLGFKGRFAEALESGDSSAVELRAAVRAVEDIVLSQADITANAVFKFFPCVSSEQELLILQPDRETVAERFYFGRQSQHDGLCLADYVNPASMNQIDYLAMFTTTIGPGVRDLSERWMQEGNYLNSHILQALAIESAEAFAELLHQQIRQMWGFKDTEGTTYQDLFRTQYRGRRYSFGYPACPRLEDQSKIFTLLDVTSNIGVELTEGFMMDPEASVSAIVFHHPEAKYFNLSESDIDQLEKDILIR